MHSFRTLALTALAAVAASAAAYAQDFPLTLPNKFGTTVIEQQPERIATIDYNGADDLLALGVQPVTIRKWGGNYPKVVWPWAAPLLTTEPAVIEKTIDYELIASAKPDVILAFWSGIDQKDYDKLSEIAPVVAVPEGMGDYAMPWDERALTVGKVIGKETKAQALVDGIRQRLADIATAHPEWQGKTATIGSNWGGSNLGAYSPTDVRMQVLMSLGFVPAPALQALAEADSFRISLSEEAVEKLDADLLLWVAHDSSDVSGVENLKGREFLTAHQQGHEIIMSKELTGAFGHSSLLSLPYVIDNLVPQIEAVLDSKE